MSPPLPSSAPWQPVQPTFAAKWVAWRSRLCASVEPGLLPACISNIATVPFLASASARFFCQSGASFAIWNFAADLVVGFAASLGGSIANAFWWRGEPSFSTWHLTSHAASAPSAVPAAAPRCSLWHEPQLAPIALAWASRGSYVVFFALSPV